MADVKYKFKLSQMLSWTIFYLFFTRADMSDFKHRSMSCKMQVTLWQYHPQYNKHTSFAKVYGTQLMLYRQNN